LEVVLPCLEALLEVFFHKVLQFQFSGRCQMSCLDVLIGGLSSSAEEKCHTGSDLGNTGTAEPLQCFWTCHLNIKNCDLNFQHILQNMFIIRF
jgi:hypothetical protein